MQALPRVACLLVLTIAASAAHAFTAPEELQVAQLVRYVLDSTQLPSGLHLNAVVSGKADYDDEIRHPYDPPGPARVDCRATKLIGVRYRVKRPKKNKFKRESFDLNIAWSHSTATSSDKALQQADRLSFQKSSFRLFPLATLELFDEIRVDGVLTLEISIGQHVLLSNSFELTGC